MYDLKIVRNYATALFKNTKNAKEQMEFLQSLKDIVSFSGKDSKFYQIMCSPVITSDVKHKGIDLVAKQIKLNNKFVTFLKVLVRNSRFMLINEVSEYFTKLYDDAHDRKQAEVFSAKAMTTKEISLIEGFLDTETGMKVNVENKIDEKLLGGVVIKYDSTMIDCSIKGALDQIEKVARKEH